MHTAHRPSTGLFPKTPNRYCLLIMLVGMAPLIAVTSVVGDRFPKPYRAKVNAHLSETVQRHALLIDRFMHDSLNTIRLLAATTDGGDLADSDRLGIYLRELQAIHGSVFEDIGLVNSEGMQVAYAGPLNLLGARYAHAAWFKSASTRAVFISDVFSGLRGYPHFIVSARKDWQGQHWILRATIDFKAFTALVEDLRMGRTGRACIINRNGDFQTRPHDDISDAAAYLACGANGRPMAGGVVRMIETGDGPATGTAILTAELNSGNWLLVFEQEVSDALVDLQHHIKLAGAFFIVGFMGIVIVAYVVGLILEAPRQSND